MPKATFHNARLASGGRHQQYWWQMEKRLLGVEEAAQYLGIQKGTLYFWAHKRMISTVKMGRRLLFDRNDLDDHIEQGKRRPTGVLADNKTEG